MVAALAVFLGTVPLRLGSMVDFLGFDADVVKLPDASDMPPRGAERLPSADTTARSRAPRPSTMAETGVLPRNSMETATARSASSSQVVCSSQPLWFGSFVRL
jgi:hypothetical protein